MSKFNVIFPEKEDREKAVNSLLGFDCSQPSESCLALLTPRARGAASLMARCTTPDVGHLIRQQLLKAVGRSGDGGYEDGKLVEKEARTLDIIQFSKKKEPATSERNPNWPRFRAWLTLARWYNRNSQSFRSGGVSSIFHRNC
jgi:hypothetical protein